MSDANYSDMEVVAVMVFRRALTANEISLIHSYYVDKVS